ncbi:MAG: 5'-nucleotidase [Lentisphaerae bacterium ADurb.Bin242]|nr:MAG: 5'-nucleotidase [Lentisphaerae bacterium ADurb.Bin242]
MPFPIEDKLVVAVASSALFRLDEADRIFREKGISAYREYQRRHENKLLEPGIAFPFVRRFLEINHLFPENQPVEVVLLSRNDPDTGMRVFHSIGHYKLGITRAAFTGGNSPFRYIPAYNVSLFLSANEDDVRKAITDGYAAGLVLDSLVRDDLDDYELRIAFDFDGVIADDSAEKVYADGGLEQFHRSEDEKSEIPMSPGPLAGLFQKLGRLRTLESGRIEKEPSYKRYLKTAIVTARNAPAHKRLATTLRNWNISVDETFFLGGMNKGRILSTLRPHIFFDDQRHPHLDAAKDFTPSVHIPFGIASDRVAAPK